MSDQLTFNQSKEMHLNTLKQYVPVVDRVHGGTHPEFHDVRKIYDDIHKKIDEAGLDRPELDEDFSKLREITNNYTVPADVCESYEAVFNMLADLDAAYQSNK